MTDTTQLLTETFPAFFAEVPTIVLRDPLAEFLGAAAGGLLEYRYADAVRLAGHSCPTVAGAYLLTRRALSVLYPDQLPVRGEIEVAFSDTQDAGVCGVIAAVVGLITGAAASGGFKGIAGRYTRRELLRFAIGGTPGEVAFSRRGGERRVALSLHLERVPADPRSGALLQRLLAGATDANLAAEFAALWQERVRRILIDHVDDPYLVSQV